PNTDRTPRYAVTDLGTLGGTFSAAFAINNRGNVAGAANLPSENQHAFLRRDGQMSDLGTLGGSNSNEGGLNERDELAIFSQTAQNDPYNENFCGFSTDSNLICLGGVWKNGKMSPLPTLGGNNATAFAINNKGQVAGFAETDTMDKSCVAPQVFDFEAAMWEPNGAVHELPPLPGDTVGFALWLNDLGQAVGSSGTCANTVLVPLASGSHAVLWEKDSSATYLGSLGGTMIDVAAGNNDIGEVDGCSDLASEILGFPGVQCHAFLWTKQTGMKDIGTVATDFSALPTSINNHGQMVGSSCDSSGNCRAFLRQNQQMRDLNSLIPADSPLYLLFGEDINEAGEIVGLGLETSTGDVHAFLATPCDQNHPDTEWCRNGESAERPMIMAPENARRLIQEQLARRYHMGMRH
ncbi:MAG: hypothetical protein WA324_09730, partial [Bryobacteraceae bacterium]